MHPTRRRVWLSLGIALVTLLALISYLIFDPNRELDLLIVNGTVVDGGLPRAGDVGIRDGRIVGISRWRFVLSKPRLRLDAQGRVVAPGFIDVHTHLEASLNGNSSFRPVNFIRQGVTTLITGNCGRSKIDLASLYTNLERRGTYVNVASLIGHNSVRQEVMGSVARTPSHSELVRMEELVTRAMRDGALGFSTGLVYTPGRFARQDEIVALAKVAGSAGGLYVSHIRDEAKEGVASIKEALEIGREAGAATHISHFKSSGPLQWHSMLARLHLLDVARENGLRVSIDAYPYDRSSTTTDVLLPDWAVEENRSGLREAARDHHARERLRQAILQKLRQDGWQDLTHVRLSAGRPEWIGHTLAEMPEVAPTLALQIENLIEVSLRGGAQAIFADMNQADVDQVIAYPFTVFGSDSAVRDPEIAYQPHPRGSGTFPKIFRHYVREDGALSWSEAIRKASGQAAEIFGLEKRGSLCTGCWADVVMLDLKRLEDRADYDSPLAAPIGIDYVIVNGVIVVDHGDFTDSNASGRALRRSR
jgi:N-acyl-D-aspartate/D-glutamate deacylase